MKLGRRKQITSMCSLHRKYNQTIIFTLMTIYINRSTVTVVVKQILSVRIGRMKEADTANLCILQFSDTQSNHSI